MDYEEAAAFSADLLEREHKERFDHVIWLFAL
jgi:hypothetical protein